MSLSYVTLCVWFEVRSRAHLRSVSPYLSTTEVRCLAADGFTIGAHGEDHIPLTALTETGFVQDVVRSCARIQEIVESGPVPYAFPFNGRQVSRAALRVIAESHDHVGLFFDTGGMAPDVREVVNRTVVDARRPLFRPAVSARTALKMAYVAEIVRCLRRRRRQTCQG